MLSNHSIAQKFSHLEHVEIEIPIESKSIQYFKEFEVAIPELEQKFVGFVTPEGGKFISLYGKNETLGEMSLIISSGKRFRFVWRFQAKFSREIYNQPLDLSFVINDTKSIIRMMPYLNELKVNEQLHEDQIYINIDEKIVGTPRIDGHNDIVRGYNRFGRSYVTFLHNELLDGAELILKTMHETQIVKLNIPKKIEKPDLTPTLIKSGYKYKQNSIGTLQKGMAYNIRFELPNVNVYSVEKPIKKYQN